MFNKLKRAIEHLIVFFQYCQPPPYLIVYKRMFVTTHATIGALVGVAVPGRGLAFVLGFLSHFLLDMIPHGDEHMLEGYKSGAKVRRAIAYVMIDAIAAVYVTLLLISGAPEGTAAIVKWGIIGSVLPDLLVAVFELTKIKPFFRRFTAWHHKNHHHIIGKYRKGRDIPFKWGVAYQVVAAIFLIRLAL